jgi:hypothetical protein
MANLSDLFSSYTSMIWVGLALGLAAIGLYGLFFTR